MDLFMRLNMKKIFAVMAVVCLANCGGGSNNDQGASFTLLGYSTNCEESPDSPNLSGFHSVRLGGATEGGDVAAGGITAAMVMRNNLSDQFIRTENAFFTYHIPGASSQPPATSSVAGIVIDKGGSSAGGDDDDDAGGATSSSTGCVGTFIVPAEVRQWLVLNKNFLPELPFTMEVRGFVTGISSAGNRYDTNEVKIFVQFVPDIVITPGTGTGSGGSGGDDANSTSIDVNDTQL